MEGIHEAGLEKRDRDFDARMCGAALVQLVWTARRFVRRRDRPGEWPGLCQAQLRHGAACAGHALLQPLWPRRLLLLQLWRLLRLWHPQGLLPLLCHSRLPGQLLQRLVRPAGTAALLPGSASAPGESVVSLAGARARRRTERSASHRKRAFRLERWSKTWRKS